MQYAADKREVGVTGGASDVSFWPHRPLVVTARDDVADPADGFTSLREAVAWATDNPG